MSEPEIDAEGIREDCRTPALSNRDGIPLTVQSARPIIKLLFEKKPQWRRQDLAMEVEKIHLQQGGIKGKQETLMVITKALEHIAKASK